MLYSLDMIYGPLPKDIKTPVFSQELIEVFWPVAETMLLKLNEHPPTLLVITDDQAVTISGFHKFMESHEKKNFIADYFTKQLKKMDARGYAFIAESWLLNADQDDPRIQKYLSDPEATLEHTKGRVETLFLAAQVRGDRTVIKIANQIRDQKGDVKSLVSVDHPAFVGNGLVGKFANMLD